MCGCGKRSAPSKLTNYRPSVGPRPVTGGVPSSPQLLVRSLSLQTAMSPKEAVRLDAERLEMMKRRREAIRAKFNK